MFGFNKNKNTDKKKSYLNSVDNFITRVKEPFTGAWQRNISAVRTDAIYNSTVFSCVTLIAQDIGKLDINVIRRDGNGVSTIVKNKQLNQLLRNPNGYQTIQDFLEFYMINLLRYGNCYILKKYDNRDNVVEMHILDPRFVKIKLSNTKDIFYEVTRRDDDLAITEQTEIYPARDIIHDKINVLNHGLVGNSPLVAAYGSVEHADNIMNGASNFFKNGSRPSGYLYTEDEADEETAAAIAKDWKENNSSIANSGSVPFLHSGLQYKTLDYTSAADSQLMEQMNLTTTQICNAFKVPEYLISANSESYNNTEQRNQQYYSQCLQTYIKSIQTKLSQELGVYDKGLELELNLDDLLKLNKSAQIDLAVKAAGGAVMTIDEARRNLNLAPIPGGNTVYLQQQNYSVAALERRDQQQTPANTLQSPQAPAPQVQDEGNNE